MTVLKTIPFKKLRHYLIFSSKNQGKGHAICRAVKLTSKDYTVLLDADLALHPSQIKSFIEIMRKTSADIVIGSKLHHYSDIHYPFIRKIMTLIYYWITKLLFNLPVHDTQTGLKLFKTEVLKKITEKISVKRFAFDLEVLVIAHKLGYKIVEAPVIIQDVRNRIRIKSIYKMIIDTLGIWYRLNILRWYQ